MKMLEALGWTDFEGLDEVEKTWMEGVDYMCQFHFVDSEHEINNILRSGKSILCEGAQGTMLDVDFGSYPFVTSSNTVCAGACTGLGIGPRCGWVDLIQLRYSIMINGVTQLILMKSDVLDSFETIKACVAYKLKDGSLTEELPYELEGVEPVYKEFPGWKTDMTKFTEQSQFPQAFHNYIKFLEDFLETPIKIVSIGPDREQTVIL